MELVLVPGFSIFLALMFETITNGPTNERGREKKGSGRFVELNILYVFI